MDSQERIIQQLGSALPNHFDFYHLGKVELQSDHFESLQDNRAVAFRIYGDVGGVEDMTALMIIFFDPALDISTYSEFGNILGSKLVSQLNSDQNLDLMVSPPVVLNASQLGKIDLNTAPAVRKTYIHIYNNTVIPVETWILPIALEGFGYA
jgi:hypothetical protein